jgi:urease accessory protein
LLEYIPDPIIPYARARYVQRTVIELAPGAGLFWWEICAPGREARGEVFAYELLEFHFELGASGTPLALERLRIEPSLRPPSSPARLGTFRYWATFYVCRAGVDQARWRELETELAELANRLSRAGETLWAASALARGGVALRVVARNGLEIPRGLAGFWRAAKLRLYGREPVLPRKVN